MKKTLILFITGAPGLLRLFTITLMASASGPNVFGEIASDLAIASILSIVCVIGPSNIMFSITSRTDRSALIYCIKYLSISTLCLYLCFKMTNQFDFLYDTFFVIQFILLWGCYHINRTYLIIKKSYITLLCLECSTILIASGCLFLSITSAVKLPISSALYAPFTLSFIWCALIFLRKRTPPEKSFRKNIFEYTASNLLTGGMLFSLPFLIGYFSSIEYAALTSLLMSIGNFIILPARALSNHFLPDLCKIKNPGPSFSQTLRAFEKNLWTITTITTVIVYCFALIAFSYLPSSYSQLDYFNFALPSTLLCIYFSQLSLPLSNALLALNMSSLTMTVNLVAAAVFAIIVCGFILFSSLHAAPSILIGLSISNIARFMILKIKAADL